VSWWLECFFVSAPPELATSLVDMEALALAKICRQQARDFHCFKYISDNADDAAAADWHQSSAIGERLFCDQVLG
jgi:adenosylhomocysteine nucleosidase